MAKAQESIRDIVEAEMKRQGITTYQLWKKVAPHLSKQTVYDFINNRKAMTSDNLALLLSALDLTIAKSR